MTTDLRRSGPGVGDALRLQRLRRGMTVARLADTIGVRPSDVGRWERGDEIPPPVRLRAIARALEVDQGIMLTWIAAAAAAGGEQPTGNAVDVVIDLAPADPFITIMERAAPVAATPRQVPVPPARPRPVAAVFPTPAVSADADRHVYSAVAGVVQPVHPRVSAGARLLRIVAALALLAAALAWTFGQLGQGFGDLVGLFGGSGPVPGG